MKFLLITFLALPILIFGLFHIHKKNNAGGVSASLLAILLGTLIFFNDQIKNFSVLGASVQMKEEIELYKDRAIEDAKKEIDRLKGSVDVLVKSANETTTELAAQKNSIQTLIKNADDSSRKLEEQRKISEGLFSEIEKQRQSLNELHKLSENTKAEIIRLNEVAKDLQLTYIKIAYLQTVTKGQFGGDQDMKVGKEIETELNRMLTLVFPKEKERNEFVTKITNILK